MSLDDNKAMARRANAIWASGNSDRLEDIFTDGYVNHQEPDIEGGVSAKNLQVYKELLARYHSTFSGSRNEVLMQIAERDWVATRWRFWATKTSEDPGVQPTGKEVTWTGIQIDRFENGKIAESWDDWDKYSLFAQLGRVK
jgi:predicted ester cyclase